MIRLAHYQKFSGWYEMGFVALFLIVNSVVNATTRIIDEQRQHDTLSFEIWEPFVWEFSSVLVILLLIPLLHRFYDSEFNDWQRPKRTLFFHCVCSLLFSLGHVVGMVSIRKLVYIGLGSSYDFGNVLFEFFYEYRKDVMSYILIMVIFTLHRAFAGRLQGEANLVSEGEENNQSSDRMLVKKLGKEFIVNINDIEWLESSGNYVNLHVGNRIYPTRATLGKLMERLYARGFCRTHRSFGVNLDAIESIKPQSTGNSEVTLKSGKVLSLSRRYRDELKHRLKI